MSKIGIKLPAFDLATNIDALHRTLTMLRDIGFSAIEITPENFRLIECGKIDKVNLLSLKTILDEYGFERILHTPQRCSLFNELSFENNEKVLFIACELCSALDAKILEFHPVRSHDEVDLHCFFKPQRCNAFSKGFMLRECITIQEIADNYPEITITIKNHGPYLKNFPYSYVEYCKELVNVIRCIDRINVRVTLDIENLILASCYHNLDILNNFIPIKNYVVLCHICGNHTIANLYTDNDKSPIPALDFEDKHTTLKRRNFPVTDFLMMMIGFSGIYSIELKERCFNKSRIREVFDTMSSLIDMQKKMFVNDFKTCTNKYNIT